MGKNEKTASGEHTNTEKSSSQIYNPLTGNYIKRDGTTGKLTEVKTDGKPFTGIKKETQITHVGGITISKSVAKKAEDAVIKTHNRKAEANGR